MRALLPVLLLLGACNGRHDPDPNPPAAEPPALTPEAPAADAPASTEERTPRVSADHPLYARVEGASLKNDCAADAGCYVGGCSSEVCSAEEGVTTSCDVIEKPQGADARCGCVSGQCVWYGSAAAPAAEEPVAQGQPCEGKTCAEGLSCVSYYGIAGPSGPKFSSCEIPCADAKSACPEGQRCVTIADGPGAVCRP